MADKSLITHPEYGKIVITRNPRARRIILRARPDAIYITLPTAATKKELERALAQCGSKLIEQQKLLYSPQISIGYSIDTTLFKFKILEHAGDKFILKQKEEHTTLFCPQGTRFDGEARQEWVKKIIINAMRRRAKEVLPARLERLSKQHGLRYTAVSLRDSHTRWGSCSSRGNISLSIYLVLLPTHLADYVLLHELCHTREMNHGERFWALLDAVAGCNAKQLRKELKRFKCALP